MVSVIVPVYKVEAYLHRCVESIINQTYTDLEIILVDDGSPDRCGQFCDEYARKYENICVIHKENGGLSDARNAGIAAAKGSFLTFVDSDDYIAPMMIELLMKKIKKHGADIAVCLGMKVFEESGEAPRISLDEPDIVMSGIDAMEALFTAKSYAPVMTWGKIYKSGIFCQTDIRFPVGRVHEDNFTTYKLFFHAQKIVFSNLELYYYFQRDDSIMGQAFQPQRMDMVEAAEQTIDFVLEKKLPLLEQSYCNYILVNLWTINVVLQDPSWKQWDSLLAVMRNNILKQIPHPLANRYLSLKHRVGLFLLLLGYWCYIPAKKFPCR